MSHFRELAHLEEQLGEERFQALISSDSTGKVKKFCDELIKSLMPTTMTVGGRTYKILGFLKEGEDFIQSDELVAKAKQLDADLGEYLERRPLYLLG